MLLLLTNLRLKLLALVVSVMLWGVANTSSSIERGFDIPVVLKGIPSDMVVTGLSTDNVNVRVLGTRAELRSFSGGDRVYEIEVEGAQPGLTTQEVDLSGFDLPRGARIVSRSPSRIDFNLARRGSRAVRVRADIVGEPAPGFHLREVSIVPAVVRVAGARSEVLRLREVVTETLVVDGATHSFERPIGLSLNERHVWLENPVELRVAVTIEPIPAPPEPEAPAEAEEEAEQEPPS